MPMTGRTLTSALVVSGMVLALLGGCRAGRGPEERLHAAMSEAHKGHFDRFLECVDPRSRKLLAMFWVVSARYGYLDDDSLRTLGSLEVVDTTIEGNRAVLRVRDGKREGDLFLVHDGEQWLIDLLAGEPAAPTAAVGGV